MYRGLSVLVCSCVVALAAAGTALGAAGSTVTATGTGQSRVLPKDRHNNASINAAYESARKASIAGAIADAHQYAVDYARAVGLTLGPVTSVTDQQSSFYGPGEGAFSGPFGAGRFCGTISQAIIKKVGGKRKVVGTKKVHRCIVPSFAYTTLTLTYAAA